jgi:hypothetical protein
MDFKLATQVCTTSSTQASQMNIAAHVHPQAFFGYLSQQGNTESLIDYLLNFESPHFLISI